MTDSCGTYYCKPTLRERFWRKIGFRFHLGEDAPDDAPSAGWMQTRSFLCLDWRDRMRLLVSGQLLLQHTFHTDTPSPDKVHTRFDWHILAPGDKGRR